MIGDRICSFDTTRDAVFAASLPTVLFLLVFTVLTIFLRPSLAIWVCFGIPISFLGALALMPWLDATINIISLFGFILVLGIVVDDAIVTGESIFTRLQQGMPSEEAAIVGTKDVAAPVTFGVLTTMVAFLPLFLMSAGRGPIWAQIPLIVIPVLAFSLVESKLILPAHLKHIKVGQDRSKMNILLRFQRLIADGLQNFVKKIYQPFLGLCLKNRYITLSVFIFLAMGIFGMFTGGLLPSNDLRNSIETSPSTPEISRRSNLFFLWTSEIHERSTTIVFTRRISPEYPDSLVGLKMRSRTMELTTMKMAM